MYAIVEINNKQFRVEQGSLISVDHIPGGQGAEWTAGRVLFVNRDSEFLIGRPVVTGAKAVCEISKQFRGDKKTAYKFRRRKNSQMKKGHRSEQTELRVKEIVLS